MIDQKEEADTDNMQSNKITFHRGETAASYSGISDSGNRRTKKESLKRNR